MFKHHLAAIAAAVSMLQAHAQWRPPVADSTGIRPGVEATLRPGLSAGAISNLVQQQIAEVPSIPRGYREVVIPMGNRYLGRDTAGETAATHFYALGYPREGQDWGGFACAGYFGSGKVVVVPYIEAGGGDNAPVGSDYYVCEPPGTRSTLEKIVGADVLILGGADLNAYVISGTIGINTSSAPRICQVKGYTGVIEGSVTFWDRGSGCNGDRVTQWNGSSFIVNDACYNQIMTGVRCWR